MANAWPWILGAAAVAIVATAGGSARANNPSDEGGDVASRKQQIYWRTRQIPDLTEDQRLFLMLTAYGEGAFNTAAHNGSQGERAASALAAKNNPSIVAWAHSCGVPTEALESGSWSMFQFLAPYYAGTVREIFGAGGCPFADPTKAPGRLDLQICLAIKHAHDLQGYDGWKARPTVANLRLGWANPGWMGYEHEHEERIAKYKSHATKVGLPSSFVDKQLSRFPSNVASIYQALVNTPLPMKDPLS